MNFEPKQLVFRDVRLNQPYTTTLCIENPLTAAVEFELRASAPARYDIKPSRVTLLPKQSISITVRLHMKSYNDLRKGVQGQSDSIHIKSHYFDQKVPVEFFMHSQSASSRSPSPAERATSRMKTGGREPPAGTDVLRELNAQIQAKDHQIAELEKVIGNLESKHPDLERVINARLEAERSQFEAKSQQVLQILRKKDEQVEALQRQLDERTRALQAYNDVSQIHADQQSLSEGKSRDYWTGRSIAPEPGMGSTHRELVDLLEQTRRQLESERHAHQNSRNELNSAYSTIEELKSKHRLLGADSVGSGRFQPQDWKELRGLREQTLDQAEQIKALLAENNRQRQEAVEQAEVGESLQQALKEVSRLRTDVVHHQKKYAELETNYAALEKSHHALEETLGEVRVQSEQLRAELENTRRAHTPPGAGGEQPRGAGGRVSWQSGSDARSSHRGGDAERSHDSRGASQMVDGMRFEDSVGGGIATSTPAHYALHPPQTAQQAIEEKNTLIGLYQDRLDRYEEEIEQLKSRVLEGQTVEADLRERLKDTEERLQTYDQEGRLLSERVERLKSEREASAHEVHDKDIQLRSALEKVGMQNSAAEVNDAHLWWAYIWHAMKQRQETTAASGISGGPAVAQTASGEHPFVSHIGAGDGGAGALQPGNVDFKPAHDAAAAVHEARLKDNLRMQAIEVAQLRQELIGRKLTYKKEIDAVKEQNEHFQREIVRLQAQSRVHRGDKDLKIAELAKTIQTLSVRGDMHAQAAAARQEVEAEKLTNHHLRADLDSYRSMLEEEQRKVLLSRKEIASLQAQIDSSLVLQSVVNVPGVAPAVLIELMAGQINQLESEVTKSRASCEETTQQLRDLQRSVQATQLRRQSLNDNASTSRAGVTPETDPNRGWIGAGASSQRSRSLSPSGRRGSTGSDFARRSGSNLNLLSSQRPFADNYTDDMNASFEDDGMRSPSSGTGWFTGAPHSLVVDGEATPKLVVESLDRAVLAQRVASQEAVIADLNHLVDELKNANMENDREKLIAADAADQSDRIEWERSLRKADLLLTLLDEARGEVKKLSARNVELEKSLSDVHSSRLVDGWAPRPFASGGDGVPYFDDAPLMGNHTSDMGSYAGAEVNFEENQKELESTKILLRERTTQLKILMETLDSLQVAGVKADSKFHSEDEYLFSRKPGDNRIPSANTSSAEDAGYFGGFGGSRLGGAGMTSQESSWGMQALIKRVVELTTELTSQCAVASLEARKAEDLELANRRQAKEINKLRMNQRNCEESASRATLQLNSMCSQLQEGDRSHIEAMASLRGENDTLTTALRETEAALEASEIKIAALLQQAEVADQSDFMGWLEMVTLDNQKIVLNESTKGVSATSAGSGKNAADEEVFNNKKIGESTVRELVQGLVLQWKEYVATVPQMKPISTPSGGLSKLSKPDQRFLQRVTDLVLNANDRACKAAHEAQSASARIKQVEHANEIAIERLKICASHLNRYRKRCHAFEKVLSSDRKHVGIKQGKLESMLKSSLADLRAKHAKTVDALRVERRDRMINDVKRAMDTQQLRKLQANIAELEAKGSSTLRARDEALASLEHKLKTAEDGMYKWFKVELPRLVSGLPATEDTLSSYYKENLDPNFGLEPSPFSLEKDAATPISTHLMSSLGMDRTYALSQALCSSRAAMTVQEMRISGLTEKLSILKERNLSLEGVLERWKTEIQQSSIANTVPSVAQNASKMMQARTSHEFEDDGLDQYLARVPTAPAGTAQGSVSTMANANRVDAAIQQVYTYADSEAQLNAKVHELTNRVIDLEEENIEWKGKFEQANARAGEMKALVDVVMSDEQLLKTKATQQLTKIRLNAAQDHAEEMRAMRQTYEAEANRLRAELDSVAVAVEEAKLTTVDTTAWQRMVAGEEDGAEGDRRFASTQPRPTPIKGYFPTPPYKEQPAPETEHRMKSKKAKKHSKKSSSNSSSTHVSSSSSSSSSGSESDTSSEGPAPDQRRRSRRRSSRRRSDRGRTERGSDLPATAPVAGGAAQTYAQTLQRRGLPAETPRTATRFGRDPMDVRITPSTNADTSASLSLSYLNQQQDLAEVQVENLERLLELERRKHEETKFEMAELQQMLEIQKNAFREHLGRGDANASAMAAASAAATAAATAPVNNPASQPNAQRNARAARSAPIAGFLGGRGQQQIEKDISLSTFDDSFSTPSVSPPPPAQGNAAPQQQQQAQGATEQGQRQQPSGWNNQVGNILSEIQREDPGLWPSLSTLLDELMSVLDGLSQRTQMLDTRLEVRTALAMAARVRIVCTSSATSRNIASAAMDAKASDFPAEKLMKELNKYTANPAAKADTSEEKSVSTAQSVKKPSALYSAVSDPADPRDYSGRLQALASRVKLIESDFADDNIPERHLYLMRDLRMRIIEVEKALSEEQATQQNQWAAERKNLIRQAEENAQLAEQVRAGQSESMSMMRQRYEEALRNAEEALESGTRAATQEIERLQGVIAQQQQLLQLHEQRQSAAYPPPPRAENNAPANPSRTVAVPQRSATPPIPPAPPATAAATAQNLNEFLRMQRLVDQTGDHLEHSRQQRQQIEALHAREVTELKTHFSRYRRAQAEVVRSLEDQLEELHERLRDAAPVPMMPTAGARLNVNDSLLGGESLASQVNSMPEAEGVIRKMEFKYRLKAAELDAVMRSLSRMATGDNETVGSRDGDQSSLNDTAYTFDVPDVLPRAAHPAGSRMGSHPSTRPSSRNSRDPGGIGAHTDGDDFGVLGNEHFDTVARDMQTELFEARIITAEKEIEALHRNLQSERSTVASLKAQLQAAGKTAKTSAASRSTVTGASPLRAPKASEEPVLPSQSQAATAGQQAPAVRLPSRRGSTGSIDRAGIAAMAAPASSAPQAGATTTAPASTTSTGAAPVATANASTGPMDPILDFNRDFEVPEGKTDNESTRMLVRRLNTVRRAAVAEVAQLKAQCAQLRRDLEEGGGGAVAELKQQMANMKEDNARRMKALATARTEKSGFETSAMQWKNEAAQNLENTKRLQRALSSKEASLKDCKAKLDDCQRVLLACLRDNAAPAAADLTGIGMDLSSVPVVSGPQPVTLANLPAAELRVRLRSSELECARHRNKGLALQQKVKELEAELKTAEESVAKLSKQRERVDDLLRTIARKDSTIQVLEAQIEKLKLKLDDLDMNARVERVEFNKKEMQLQRQMEMERSSRQDLEKESRLMRQREVDANERELSASQTRRGAEPTRRASDFLSNTGGTSSNMFESSTARSSAQPLAATARATRDLEERKSPVPQQRRSSVGAAPTPSGDSALPRRGGSQSLGGVFPATLESSQGDLEDVMQALGVSPLHVGLGTNPRRSSVSSAYTHNTTGRGSTLDRENVASPPESSPQGDVGSVERRFRTLTKSLLQSPVRQRRL